jgi:hypothetical protein
MPDGLDQLIRDLSRLDARARTGSLDEENATKLAYQEFGTERAPPRPTLSAATDRAEGDIARAIDRRVAQVIAGQRTMTGKTLLGEVAGMLQEQVVEAIDGNIPPELAPSTLAARRRRGNESTRTLVDTGDMKASITTEAKDGASDWPDDG